VARLCNFSDYIIQTWNEALPQLLGTQALVGALMGHSHPIAIVYGLFLEMYSKMLIRLEFEIDQWYCQRLPPPA
jgi:ABC-type phosphate transport system permease subunit